MSPEVKTKARMGRPRTLGVGDRLTVRVSGELHARLAQFGKEEGWSPAQALRAYALLGELVLEDPSVLLAMARDPLARRTELVKVVKQRMFLEPSLPMEGLDGG